MAAVGQDRKIFGGTASIRVDLDVGSQPLLRHSSGDRMVAKSDHSGVLARPVAGLFALARRDPLDCTVAGELERDAMILVAPADANHAIILGPMREGVIG